MRGRDLSSSTMMDPSRFSPGASGSRGGGGRGGERKSNVAYGPEGNQQLFGWFDNMPSSTGNSVLDHKRTLSVPEQHDWEDNEAAEGSRPVSKSPPPTGMKCELFMEDGGLIISVPGGSDGQTPSPRFRLRLPSMSRIGTPEHGYASTSSSAASFTSFHSRTGSPPDGYRRKGEVIDIDLGGYVVSPRGGTLGPPMRSARATPDRDYKPPKRRGSWDPLPIPPNLQHSHVPYPHDDVLIHGSDKEGDDNVEDEAAGEEEQKPETPKAPVKRSGLLGLLGFKKKPVSEEEENKRYFRRHGFFIFLLEQALIFAIMGSGLYRRFRKSVKDGQWERHASLIFLPWLYFVMIFGIHVIVSNIIYVFGPIAHTERNSTYHSPKVTKLPKLPKGKKRVLPGVTVQVPVYKEDFSLVLQPTLESIMEACERYKEDGGTTNIIVHDDGLLLLARAKRWERIDYYHKHNIAFVARPPQHRRGRFKKASNLNFGMSLSVKIREIVEASKGAKDSRTVLQELMERADFTFRAAGNLEFQEYILLIDSDTRIPVDCMVESVAELDASPDVAFLQHLTYPLQLVYDYWENAISHFTDTIYSVALVLATAGGDPAPLVGHNVFLRWSTMQEVAFIDPYDGELKYWSEDNVSEDFDYSMRCQGRGYEGRYAAYARRFEEGVSLTVHDEISRFKKYAYGSSEMIFNPITEWHKKGVFSKVFIRYLFTKSVPLQARVNLVGYLGTYFAMAAAPIGSMYNYFAFAWDPMYANENVRSIDIMVTIFLTFSILSPVAIYAIKYRLGLKPSLWGEFKHSLTFLIFWSGLGYHLLVAIACHFFGFEMNFGATVKEVKRTNFFKEVKQTLVGYWPMYLWCMAGGAIIAGFAMAPEPYRIREIHSVVPFSWVVFFTAVMPVFLNPVLMMIKF